MRYYAGQGVGHTYGWLQQPALQSLSLDECEPDAESHTENQEVSAPQENLCNDAARINTIDRRSLFSDAGSDGECEGITTAIDGVDRNEVESEDDEFYAHYEMYNDE